MRTAVLRTLRMNCERKLESKRVSHSLCIYSSKGLHIRRSIWKEHKLVSNEFSFILKCFSLSVRIITMRSLWTVFTENPLWLHHDGTCYFKNTKHLPCAMFVYKYIQCSFFLSFPLKMYDCFKQKCALLWQYQRQLESSLNANNPNGSQFNLSETKSQRFSLEAFKYGQHVQCSFAHTHKHHEATTS